MVFRVGATNGRSRAAMEKIGGRLTDQHEVTRLGEREIVHVIYEITRESFAAGPLMAAR